MGWGINLYDLVRIPIKSGCNGYYLRWYYNGWHYWFFLPGKYVVNTEGENYRTIGTRKVAMGTGQITRSQCDAIRTIMNTREVYLLTISGWMNIRVEPGTIGVYDNQINGNEFEFIAIIGSREITYTTGYSPVPGEGVVPPLPVITMFYITHHTAAFTMLIEGLCDIVVYWEDGSSNSYSLSGIATTVSHNYTDGITEHTITIDYAVCVTSIIADGQSITEFIIPPNATNLTELILPNNELTEVVIPETVDIEIIDLTNNPLTVCELVIGSQIWMCKNFDSNYPNSKVYNNDEANRDIYGGLYAHSQVMSPGFCPHGWHVPSLSEFLTLITYLGGAAVAGGKLKEIGTTHWNAPNTGAVDTYGFSARGAGEAIIGLYSDMYNGTWFWTAEAELAPGGVYNVYAFSLGFDRATIIQLFLDPLPFHFSVRLIRDAQPPPVSYNDWFLPSRYEFAEVYTNVISLGLGGFDITKNYWTSSETLAPATQAFAMFAGDGSMGVALKSGFYKVRAIRSFTSGIGDYSLGDRGPAGGWIFYITGTTYYEVAQTDCADSAWSNIIAAAVGTTSYNIGEGQNNTNEIIAQVGHTNSAAKLCNDLVVIYP